MICAYASKLYIISMLIRTLKKELFYKKDRFLILASKRFVEIY